MEYQGAVIGNEVNETNTLHFLLGAYRSDKWTVPYLTSTLSLAQAAEYLNLAADIPGLDEADWTVEDLYQREIDWIRVDKSIYPYVKAHDIPKFFNALTVVLVPHRGVGGIYTAKFSQSETWQSPAALGTPDELEIGPIRLGFFGSVHDEHGNVQHESNAMQSGVMRWNKEQVYAIAIDGQHRLAALKTLKSKAPGETKILSSRVPVLFLLFDERLGFESPNEDNDLKLMRKVFIDLNKHSVVVNRARNILLDDRDPQAVCVRALMQNRLAGKLSSTQDEVSCLSLALVDWHSESAKFDSGPYLATVLGLDWMVTQLVGIQPLRDFTDYQAVKRQLNAIKSVLKWNGEEAFKRLQTMEDAQRPFAYTDADLDDIRSHFSQVYATGLVNFMMNFGPYKDLIDLRSHRQSFTLEWQHWFKLQANALSGETHAVDELVRYEDDLRDRDVPVNTNEFSVSLKAINDFKKSNLAFYGVFQKALFLALNDFSKVSEIEIQQLDEVPKPSSGAEVDFGVKLDVTDADSVPVDETPDEGVEFDIYVQTATGLAQQQFEQSVDWYLEGINNLVAKVPQVLQIAVDFKPKHGTEKMRLWAGSLLRPPAGVDFTQVASVRAKDILLSAVLMHFIKSSKSGQTKYATFDAIWEEAIMPDPSSPSLIKRLGSAINRMAGGNGLAPRIIAERQDEYDLDVAREEVFERLNHLWNAI